MSERPVVVYLSIRLAIDNMLSANKTWKKFSFADEINTSLSRRQDRCVKCSGIIWIMHGKRISAFL